MRDSSRWPWPRRPLPCWTSLFVPTTSAAPHASAASPPLLNQTQEKRSSTTRRLPGTTPTPTIPPLWVHPREPRTQRRPRRPQEGQPRRVRPGRGGRLRWSGAGPGGQFNNVDVVGGPGRGGVSDRGKRDRVRVYRIDPAMAAGAHVLRDVTGPRRPAHGVLRVGVRSGRGSGGDRPDGLAAGPGPRGGTGVRWVAVTRAARDARGALLRLVDRPGRHGSGARADRPPWTCQREVPPARTARPGHRARNPASGRSSVLPALCSTGEARNLYAFGWQRRRTSSSSTSRSRTSAVASTTTTRAWSTTTQPLDWTVAHNTIRKNGGAGVMLGDGNTLSANCLERNGQYGFSAYQPDGGERDPDPPQRGHRQQHC